MAKVRTGERKAQAYQQLGVMSSIHSHCFSVSSLVLLLVFSGLKIIPSVHSFNVDTKAPIVKFGSPDSYFGYSVAIHLRPDPITGATQPVILVGAPRDNITDSLAPSGVKQLVRPGVVYQCPITSNLRDCQAIHIDREGPTNKEDKNNQWMGVSVVSQGTENGQALAYTAHIGSDGDLEHGVKVSLQNGKACAHLYRLSEPGKRAGIGKCISMYNDLTEESPELPCEGLKEMAVSEIYAYAFCQAGVSAAIGPDADILIGTPGAYSWRGSMFKRFLSGSGQEDMTWHQTPVEDPIDGHGPKPATQYYSVLGMSSKIVNIIGQRWYIGGAPRSKFNGEVLMFRFIDGQFRLEPEHVLHGHQIGSGFGYDIVVADFNGDKKEDLVASAPFYHAHLVGGAIFVYYHGASGITSLIRPQVIYSRKMKEQECIQLHCHDARFGLAMTSVGDIDRDGYQDLAVGAPYEGNGVVYIYRGSSHGLITDPQHVQRISASDVFRSPPKTFGASLTGGIDIDQNGYPDLVVGSFASSSIAVLRARPVVRITATISSSPERIERKDTQCRLDGSPNVCVELRVCFKYEAEPKEWFSSRMDVIYQIDADKYSVVKPPRIIFSRVESPVMNGSLSMNPPAGSAVRCSNHLAYIAKHTRDFMTPVTFLLTYKLPDTGIPRIRPGEPLDSINDYPVTNEAASHLNFSVPFAVNCGDDHLCNSNITIQPYISALERDSAGDKYKLKVDNRTEIILIIPVTNSGEDAHQTVLTIELPETVDYVETISEGVDRQTCSPLDNFVYCTVGNPLIGGQRVSVAMRLDVQRVLPSDGLSQLDFIVRVNTTSLNMNANKSVATVSVMVLFETDIAIRGSSIPEQVLYSGAVLGESVINTEELIGSKVEYNYEVVNFGKISVSNVKLVVKWPHEWKMNPSDEHGKNLLYLLRDPLLIAGDNVNEGYCHYEKEWVNPLDVQLADGPRWIGAVQPSTEANADDKQETGQRRRRRETARTAESTLRGVKIKKPVVMDCDNARVNCRLIECVLGELAPRDSITLRLAFRLWNHTFVEDFIDVSEVRIMSRAEIKLDSTTNVVQTNTLNDGLNLMLTAIPDGSVREKEGVPLWIIVVSVIVGVILLSLCIILLWKCGFFKRRRHSDKDDLETHQALRTKLNDDSY